MYVILGSIYKSDNLGDFPDTLDDVMKTQEAIDFLDTYLDESMAKSMTEKGVSANDVRTGLVYVMAAELYFRQIYIGGKDGDDRFGIYKSFSDIRGSGFGEEVHEFVMASHRVTMGLLNILSMSEGISDKGMAVNRSHAFIMDVIKAALAAGYEAGKSDKFPIISGQNSLKNAEIHSGKIGDMGVGDDIIDQISSLDLFSGDE